MSSATQVEGSLKTADPEMKRLALLATNVATSRATILITGESGTGKEVFARFIHSKSPRSARRLVVVNCAVIQDENFETELLAKLESANQSTVLLSEISELRPTLQAKLLRILQDGEFERAGARAPVKLNVRVLATSNRDLSSMVRSGQFREDLYYRLNVIQMSIPSLRQRPRDVEELSKFFVEVSSLVNGKVGKSLSEEALLKLKGWRWPGNVRELENVIERAVLMSASSTISADEIELSGAVETSGDVATTSIVVTAGDLTPGMTIGEAERRLIMKTLEYTSQNRTKAAQLLGISIRTLRNKLHEYGVAPAGGLDQEGRVDG